MPELSTERTTKKKTKMEQPKQDKIIQEIFLRDNSTEFSLEAKKLKTLYYSLEMSEVFNVMISSYYFTFFFILFYVLAI